MSHHVEPGMLKIGSGKGWSVWPGAGGFEWRAFTESGAESGWESKRPWAVKAALDALAAKEQRDRARS